VTTATGFVNVLGGIAWDPEVRNILAVLVGITVLIGSVYLLVSTNAGPRTGMLITLAGLFGWIATMGLVWSMYGIGLKGSATHWQVVEIVNGTQPDHIDLNQANTAAVHLLKDVDEQTLVAQILAKYPQLGPKINTTGDPAKQFSLSELVDAQPSLAQEYGLTPDKLGNWHLLKPSDKQRGDATAIADAALADAKSFGNATSSASYRVIDVYDFGGKGNAYPLSTDRSCHVASPGTWGGCFHRISHKLSTIVHFQHPTHYAVVITQAVVNQPTKAGQAPPTPLIDTRQPKVAVVMVRDLGDLRFPAVMVTLVSGTLFALCCNTLHRRDKLIARNRAAALAA
jgi:hypothetical protein